MYPTSVCSDMLQQHENWNRLALNETFHGIGRFHIEMWESLFEQGKNKDQEKRKGSEDHGNVWQLTCGVLHHLKFIWPYLTNKIVVISFSYNHLLCVFLNVHKCTMYYDLSWQACHDALPFNSPAFLRGNERLRPQIRRYLTQTVFKCSNVLHRAAVEKHEETQKAIMYK